MLQPLTPGAAARLGKVRLPAGAWRCALLPRLLDEMSCHEKLPEDLTRFTPNEPLLRQTWMHRSRCVRGLEVRPGVEVRRGIDGAVVAEAEQLVRVDLEMQVRRTRERVTGVADEADHLSRPHIARVEDGRGVSGEMGVVELVGDAVAHPDPPAAGLPPADAVDRSACDGDDRRSERREDVVSVMPPAVDVAAEVAVRVDVAGLADHREDVVA
jgi:hypothetical protein